MWMPCSSSSHLWITEAFCSVARKIPCPFYSKMKMFFRFKLSVWCLFWGFYVFGWVCIFMCGPVCHEDSPLDNMAVWDHMVVSTPCSWHNYHNAFGRNEPHLMPHWAYNSLENRHFVHSDHPMVSEHNFKICHSPFVSFPQWSSVALIRLIGAFYVFLEISLM